MKRKFINFGVLISMLLVASPVMAMTCTVNGREIPCDIFWANYGLFLAIPFILLGLLFSIKPDWILRFQVWWMKILGSTWVPGKIIPKIYRIMGIVFLVPGLVFLYLTIIH